MKNRLLEGVQFYGFDPDDYEGHWSDSTDFDGYEAVLILDSLPDDRLILKYEYNCCFDVTGDKESLGFSMVYNSLQEVGQALRAFGYEHWFNFNCRVYLSGVR